MPADQYTAAGAPGRSKVASRAGVRSPRRHARPDGAGPCKELPASEDGRQQGQGKHQGNAATIGLVGRNGQCGSGTDQPAGAITFELRHGPQRGDHAHSGRVNQPLAGPERCKKDDPHDARIAEEIGQRKQQDASCRLNNSGPMRKGRGPDRIAEALTLFEIYGEKSDQPAESRQGARQEAAGAAQGHSRRTRTATARQRAMPGYV